MKTAEGGEMNELNTLLVNASDLLALSEEQEEEVVSLTSLNSSLGSSGFDNPFNDPTVKALFICLYSAVFLVCCIGNSLVLYTIGRNKRMRTRTNFFLANLAGADLAVGVLCVLPKLSTYMSLTWILGEAMCKIYYFVQSLTYTASVLLLTAVAVERYIAILHPLRSRRLVTQSRLIISQIIIWVISAAYNSPELTMFNLVSIDKGNTTLLFCFCTKPYTNMGNYYTINFGLWYILPLSIMTFMYVRVACTLWESCKLASNDIRLKTLAEQRPCHRNHKGPTCCDYNGDIDTSRKRRSSSPKIKRHCMGQEIVPLGDSTWEKNSPYHLTAGRNFPIGSKGEKFHISVLLCTAAKKNRNNGSDGTCSSPGALMESTITKDGAEQRLLDAVVLPSSSTRNCRPPSTRLPQKGNGAKAPAFNHYCSNNNQNLYLWPASRPRHTSMSCDLSGEGSSETTSTEEYDMQLPKTHNCIPRRMKVQYRVNSQRVLHSRKRVIRLLVVVLLTFAVCVLPFHLKNVLMFWNIYPTPTSRMDVLSPLAFVLLYMNSAINPILFWVFSDTFRRSLRDSFKRGCCK